MLEYCVKAFKVIKRNDDKISTKYIAKIKQRPLVTDEDLYRKVELGCTLTRGEVGLALDEFFDAAIFELEHGRPVQIGRFGTLRVRLEASGKDSPKEVDLKSVKKKTITFIPSRELMRTIQETPLQKSKYTRREVK